MDNQQINIGDKVVFLNEEYAKSFDTEGTKGTVIETHKTGDEVGGVLIHNDMVTVEWKNGNKTALHASLLKQYKDE